MTEGAHNVHYSYGEYVLLEGFSNVKHEFLNGQIYAMGGGTPEHAALAAAIIALLFPQLRAGNCRAYTSDLRLSTPSGLDTYPDVTIVCGAPVMHPHDKNAITNPTVIVEVLSRTTEEYDRTDKFDHYKSFDSLQQYILVSHRERAVDVWTRSGAQWTQTTAREGDRVQLTIGAQVGVRDLYDAAVALH